MAGGVDTADVRAGRRLFFEAGCTSCHGGGKWTTSTKNFVSPPAAAEIFTETSPAPAFRHARRRPVPEPPSCATSARSTSAWRVGATCSARTSGAEEHRRGEARRAEALARQDALGLDYNGDGKGNGYNVPSLLGIYALPPYYHNGACETLDCVVGNVKHRTANGTARTACGAPGTAPGSSPSSSRSMRRRRRRRRQPAVILKLVVSGCERLPLGPVATTVAR